MNQIERLHLPNSNQISVTGCESYCKSVWVNVTQWASESVRDYLNWCVCVCAREREHESVGTDQSMSQCESVSLSELVCVWESVWVFESVWVNQWANLCVLKVFCRFWNTNLYNYWLGKEKIINPSVFLKIVLFSKPVRPVRVPVRL